MKKKLLQIFGSLGISEIPPPSSAYIVEVNLYKINNKELVQSYKKFTQIILYHIIIAGQLLS